LIKESPGRLIAGFSALPITLVLKILRGKL